MNYLVIGRVKRDGKLLKLNSVVDLDPDEGARLVRGGYLALAPAIAESNDSSKKPAGKAK